MSGGTRCNVVEHRTSQSPRSTGGPREILIFFVFFAESSQVPPLIFLFDSQWRASVGNTCVSSWVWDSRAAGAGRTPALSNSGFPPRRASSC